MNEAPDNTFWDQLVKDAQTYREAIHPLRKLLSTAFGVTVENYYPSGDYFFYSDRYGRFVSSSLAACLEWLTRAVADEQRLAEEYAEVKAKETTE